MPSSPADGLDSVLPFELFLPNLKNPRFFCEYAGTGGTASGGENERDECTSDSRDITDLFTGESGLTGARDMNERLKLRL